MIRNLNDSYLIKCEDVESRNAITKQINKIISDVMINDNTLILIFEDSSKLKIWDGEQQCCELRYMSTSDKLKDIIGQKLIGVELKSGETIESENVTESMFLNIFTNKDVLEIVTYNEHNGYYSGFKIMASN